MVSRHVAVDVLTGFLGSGKTTLLSHVLAHGLAGSAVAVVDERDRRRRHRRHGRDRALDYVEKMVELSSGCICCSIDEYRFDLAIQEIIETVAAAPDRDRVDRARRSRAARLPREERRARARRDHHGRRRGERRALPRRDRGRGGADRGRRLPGRQQDRSRDAGRRSCGCGKRLARSTRAPCSSRPCAARSTADVLFATDVADHRERAGDAATRVVAPRAPTPSRRSSTGASAPLDQAVASSACSTTSRPT